MCKSGEVSVPETLRITVTFFPHFRVSIWIGKPPFFEPFTLYGHSTYSANHNLGLTQRRLAEFRRCLRMEDIKIRIVKVLAHMLAKWTKYIVWQICNGDGDAYISRKKNKQTTCKNSMKWSAAGRIA